MTFEVFGFEITGPVLVLGTIVGMTYGLLGVGLVLVYRANKVINFAHGEIGSLGAAFLGIAVVRWNVPYWLFFPVAIAISAAVGAGAEAVVIRRFRNAPKLMSVVASLGVAVFLLGFSAAISGAASRSGANFPTPPGLPSFFIGPLRVTEAFTSILILTPVIVVALAVFFRYSRLGIGIRAAAANPERARTVGISPGRMSTMAWVLAGAVAAFTAILVFPTRGFIVQSALGPTLLMRALAPAVLARMERLPLVFGGGVAVGILEQHLIWNYPTSPGFTELVLFGAVFAAMLFQRSRRDEDPEKGRWAAVQPWRKMPDHYREVWLLRNLGTILVSVLAVFGAVLPLFLTNHASIALAAVLSLSIVGLSVGIVTGLGGQLSLGQYALAGVGAFTSAHVATETNNFFLSFATAAAVGAVVSLVVGLPALRIRGLFLTVTTLAFAIAAQSWFFAQGWAGAGRDPGRPLIGSFTFEIDRNYYYITLVTLLLAMWVSRNVWRSGVSRRLRGVRDNEDGARAFGIPVTQVKLQTFMLAGAFAGFGGASFGHSLSTIGAGVFGVEGNISQVAMAVLGGVGSMAGPVIGAFYIFGVPRFVPLDAAGLAASSFGWLLLLLYFPGGLAQLIRPVRDRVVEALARRAGVESGDLSVEPQAEEGETLPQLRMPAEGARRRPKPKPDGEAVLRAEGITRTFGGVKAVDDVDLGVVKGELLGIIGPNGAGKSTLFDLLSGFERPDEGTVLLDGANVTQLSPEERTTHGLIRSFQDAALFPTMTVLETVKLALERSVATRLVPAALGSLYADRRQEERAREIIADFGLHDFRDRQIRELSTGTRRICELACTVALEPRVLLLDEPSSGIAQRETEALGEVLVRIRQELGATMLVIEHDMPLIMGISDRIVAMESGRVIAEGSPQKVRRSTAVVEAYLGAAHVVSVNGQAARCSHVTSRGTQCTRRAVSGGACRQHQQSTRRKSRKGVR